MTKFDQYRDWMIARLISDTGSRIGELLEIVPSEIDITALQEHYLIRIPSTYKDKRRLSGS